MSLERVKYCLLGFALLISGGVLGQGKPKKVNVKKLLNESREAVRVEEYQYALPLLEAIDSVAPEELEHHYLLGRAYLGIGMSSVAVEHLKTSLQVETPFEDVHYYIGRVYHLNHEFDSAELYYKNHLETEVLDNHPKEEINNLLQQCAVGRNMLKNKKEVQLQNLGSAINSPFSDFAPVMSADETRLIFTSRRDGNVGGYDPILGDYYEDIYIIEKDDEGNWGKPRNMSEVNTPTHDASIGLSPDGDQLFVYRANETAGRLSGDIYLSEYDSGRWSNPVRMPDGINSRYWEPHASITADGQTLFFTSNREEEGAKGGRDIYMVRRLPDLTWALPVNLSMINTSFDEDAPFIHPDGRTLYYSSNGPGSMGGFDIFISEYDEETETWSDPKNMGYPINTAGDDIYVVWSADGERGYFSSERADSFGEKDIYMVTFPAKKVNPIVMKGIVTDARTGKPLDAIIEVVDNKTQKIVNIANSNGMTGKYAIIMPPNKNYGVRFKRLGYLFKSSNINVPDQFEYLEIVQNAALKPIDANQYEVLNNVFFGEDLGLRYESDSELQDLKEFQSSLPENYLIEVMVHKDNTEDSLLSIFKTQAMAESITVKLAVLKGDNRDALPVGVGSKFPAYSNTTERGRKLNNRVEYILRTGSAEEVLAHQNEEERPEPETPTYEAIEPPTPPIRRGDVIAIKHRISFKTNSSILKTSSYEALEELATFLIDHPKLVVEVAGHTDSQGTDAYNIDLGARRASVVAQQLIFRGVDKSRLVIKSYGESQPIASNDTPEGRAKNRRTVFKVLSNGSGEGTELPVEQAEGAEKD